MLAAAPPGMQKQMLREKLFPAVARLQPKLAGKITGMMLGLDNCELLSLLQSDAQLKIKVAIMVQKVLEIPGTGPLPPPGPRKKN